MNWRQHFGAGRNPKVRFKAEFDAYVQKQRNDEHRHEQLVAYLCPTCDGWHLGHKPNQETEDTHGAN